jgi:hypothetical protein
MALTPAEKQQHYRDRQNALAQSRPDAIEQRLLADVERAERGELPVEEQAALADKLAEVAKRHLFRAQELARIAEKVRPAAWVPPDFPP